ncbi:MAG TPA: transglycosylase domain-containing protein [Ideonella sp.]|nr:transglycosylase domain-containing protein [Ideonella sp.]
MKNAWSQIGRLIGLLLLCALALQLYFLLRVAMMLVMDPQSTSFQRSEIWRLAVEQHEVLWSQQWVDDDKLSSSLKRAVIASEDAGFAEHSGVEWDALEKAWERNQKAEERAGRINEQLAKREATREAAREASRKAAAQAKAPAPRATPKIVGGSTITQQLAKNLFLSGERTALRKAQEFVITFMLEALLDKRRILAIYLNSVEWGEGIFGAQAAARHYFRVDAAQLGVSQAARLAVMLPAPKRFEKRPGSAYVVGRAGTVAARMGAVELP